MRAVLQIYQGTTRTGPIAPVSVRNRIVDATGRAVRDQRLIVTEQDFVNRTAGMSVEMSGLSPGSYVLTVDASIADRSASRAIPFSVR